MGLVPFDETCMQKGGKLQPEEQNSGNDEFYFNFEHQFA